MTPSATPLPRQLPLDLAPARKGVDVSVVMAVYNSEATLRRAINSVLAQTHPEWELVAVDDGSTDSSLAILQEYAAHEPRLKVVSQPNAGVAATRSRATSLAGGTYLLHLDPDDSLHPRALELMLARARQTGADITVCNFRRLIYRPDGSHSATTDSQQYPKATPPQLVRRLADGSFHGSLCNKLIRRHSYAATQARFFEGVNVGEDMLVVLQLLLGGATVAFIPQALYNYSVMPTGSLTSTYTRHSYDTRMRFIAIAETLIAGAGPHFATRASAEAVAAYRFHVKFWGVVAHVVDKEEFYATPQLNRFRYLLRHRGGRRHFPAIAAALLHLWPLTQRLLPRN